MTTQQAREIFNAAAGAHLARGDADAAAKVELVREYFTNPKFAKALADHLWEREVAR